MRMYKGLVTPFNYIRKIDVLSKYHCSKTFLVWSSAFLFVQYEIFVDVGFARVIYYVSLHRYNWNEFPNGASSSLVTLFFSRYIDSQCCAFICNDKGIINTLHGFSKVYSSCSTKAVNLALHFLGNVLWKKIPFRKNRLFFLYVKKYCKRALNVILCAKWLAISKASNKSENKKERICDKSSMWNWRWINPHRCKNYTLSHATHMWRGASICLYRQEYRVRAKQVPAICMNNAFPLVFI